MTEFVAYAVRILSTGKDGESRERWLASAIGWRNRTRLSGAVLFDTPEQAVEVAKVHGLDVVKVVPVVAVEIVEEAAGSA